MKFIYALSITQATFESHFIKNLNNAEVNNNFSI